MSTAIQGEEAPRTYGNYRRPQTAGLMGLGSIGTGILLFGAVWTVVMMMTPAGLVAALVSAVFFAGLLLTVSVKDKHGKSVLARTGERAGWMMTKANGTNVYRSGPLGRVDWGTFQLPGLAAPSKLSEHRDSYNRPFAMIHVPSTGHYTVVIGAEPDGSALVDREQIDAWVADWGLWLANLGDEPGIEAAAVTVETAPDTGTRLRQSVALRIDEDAPALAQSVLAEVVDRYPAGSATVKAYVSITFNATSRVGGKKRSAEEMARELAARLPGLTQGLASTGAGAARPLGAQELCEAVAIAYDPAIAPYVDQANAAGEPPELSWPNVGPSAAEARWDSYRHDSGTSVTWQMSTAPRGVVQSSILTRLLAPHRDVARKRITMLYRPIDAARAAGIVEADVSASTFNIGSTNKPSARAVLGARSAIATANEEASGAGLVNFGMLVTATVLNSDGLADARAAIDNLSATARIRLRPVYGSQDSAFAAALPLGLVLPQHLRVPTSIKEQL